MTTKAIFNWSGGKDSALALYKCLSDPKIEISSLLTSVNREVERISMHGVRMSLLEEQVRCLGLPLSILSLPNEVSMDTYDALMHETLKKHVNSGVTHSVFGDIFLEDLKKYREDRLKQAGLKGLFPLWKMDTSELIYEFLDRGFKTIVVAIDGSKLDKSFAGRVLDKDFLKDLPPNVDPCGENGEFHTFVYEGPIFKETVHFEKGEVVAKKYALSKESDEKVTYYFQDLAPLKNV